MSSIKGGMAWFIITLVAYALILYFLGGHELPSFIYHALLLVFPLALILIRRDNVQALGLVKGKWRVGLSFAFAVILIVFVVDWLRYREFTVPTLNIALMAIIFAPITEELFFRGYLQPRLETRFGKRVGLVSTAILFMIIHLPKVLLTPLATLVDLPFYFIMGIIYGVIRDESGSVYYPTLCHAGYNLVKVFRPG